MMFSGQPAVLTKYDVKFRWRCWGRCAGFSPNRWACTERSCEPVPRTSVPASSSPTCHNQSSRLVTL